MTPHMSSNELSLFRKYLDKSLRYLEFGAGGSTLLAIENPLRYVVSVESDRSWVDKLEKMQEVQSSMYFDKLTLFHADIGPTGIWGHPIYPYNKDLFPKYSSGIFTDRFVGGHDHSNFSCVFVDGRFRVACVLNTLLYVKTDPDIIIHDYWDRASYHIIERFIKPVAGTGTLMVGRRKKNIDIEEIKELVTEYQYHPEL